MPGALAAANDGNLAVVFNSQAKVFSTVDAEVIPTGIPIYNSTATVSASRAFFVGGSPLGFLALFFGNTGSRFGAIQALRWSADASTWNATGPTSYSLTYIGMSTAGFYGWQLGGGQNPSKAFRSLDGITWTNAGLPSFNLNGTTTINGALLASAGLNLVAWERVGTSRLSISANAGLTWTARTPTPVITGKTWNFSAYAGGKFFLFTTGNQYAVTSDFRTWQLKPLPFTDVFKIACASPSGSKIVVIGDREQAAVCVDTTAETWVTEPIPIAGRALSCITASSTNFIAFGNNECCVRNIARSGLPSF